MRAGPPLVVGISGASGAIYGVRLLEVLRTRKIPAHLVVSKTAALTLKEEGPEGDRTTIPTTFFGGFDERTKKFEADFIQRAKAAGVERFAAGQFDAATYGIVQIYAQAMKTANVTGDPSRLAAERSAISDEIRKMKDFPALEGPISFGANGDALKPAYIIEVKNGKWSLLARYPAGG